MDWTDWSYCIRANKVQIWLKGVNPGWSRGWMSKQQPQRMTVTGLDACFIKSDSIFKLKIQYKPEYINSVCVLRENMDLFE